MPNRPDKCFRISRGNGDAMYSEGCENAMDKVERAAVKRGRVDKARSRLADG